METISAIATLGKSSAGTPITEGGTKGTFRYNVNFAETFASVPVVVATPLQGTNYPPNIADTFAVTVITVSTKGFAVNVNRVDALNQGWDQDLRLQYMASV
jgi:hypothetical protein